MTLILNQSDWDELYEQAPVTCPTALVLEDFEELSGVPERLGRGYGREMNLLPGIWLCFSDCTFDQDVIGKTPVHKHPIQISIFPSGLLSSDAYPTFGGSCSYFSGSGVSPAYTSEYRAGERVTCLNIEIEPELLMANFLTESQCNSELGQLLFKGEDWKVSFYPTVTPAIQAIVQQMWHAPYRGPLKRMYLQAKVTELLVIYLDLIAPTQPPARPRPRLKPDTIAQLHQAKDILETHLENPPAVLELAQQVGLSERTLLRGFRQLFGTTVIGYSMQQRLQQAEHRLRQGDRTVAEVARSMGYGHLGHFAASFKRQFGITPSECLAGKKAVL